MPTSPFTSEVERQRAREALRVIIEAAHMEAEMPLAIRTAKMSRHLDRFDCTFPRIVDALEETRTDAPHPIGYVGHPPTPPDFDAALMAYGNAMFDCGEWDEDDTNGTPYKDLSEVGRTARQRVREVYEAVVRERDKWERLAAAHYDRARAAESRNFNDAVAALADKINVERDKGLLEMGEQLQALRAAQQGEVFTVNIVNRGPYDSETIGIALPGHYKIGDRVRATRIEEGA